MPENHADDEVVAAAKDLFENGIASVQVFSSKVQIFFNREKLELVLDALEVTDLLDVIAPVSKTRGK